MENYADVVSSPRFVPRHCAVEPDLFGRTATIEWESATGDAAIRIATAQIQHGHAYRIRSAAKAQFGSVKKYADTNELNYDRLAKILRGAAIMRLEDIAQAQELLGLDTDASTP